LLDPVAGYHETDNQSWKPTVACATARRLNLGWFDCPSPRKRCNGGVKVNAPPADIARGAWLVAEPEFATAIRGEEYPATIGADRAGSFRRPMNPGSHMFGAPVSFRYVGVSDQAATIGPVPV
jgi:hypothetical protein